MFIGASDAARSLLGFRNLTEAGLDDARSDALKQGRSETPVGIGHMVLQRVGTGADIGLVALIAPGAQQRPPACRAGHAAFAGSRDSRTAALEARRHGRPPDRQPIPDYEAPACRAKPRPSSR